MRPGDPRVIVLAMECGRETRRDKGKVKGFKKNKDHEKFPSLFYFSLVEVLKAPLNGTFLQRCKCSDISSADVPPCTSLILEARITARTANKAKREERRKARKIFKEGGKRSDQKMLKIVLERPEKAPRRPREQILERRPV